MGAKVTQITSWKSVKDGTLYNTRAEAGAAAAADPTDSFFEKITTERLTNNLDGQISALEALTL